MIFLFKAYGFNFFNDNFFNDNPIKDYIFKEISINNFNINSNNHNYEYLSYENLNNFDIINEIEIPVIGVANTNFNKPNMDLNNNEFNDQETPYIILGKVKILKITEKKSNQNLKNKQNRNKENINSIINFFNKKKFFFDSKIKLDENTIESIFLSYDFIKNYLENHKNIKISDENIKIDEKDTNTNSYSSYFISFDFNTLELKGSSSGSSIALGLFLLENYKKEELKKRNINSIIIGSIDENGKLLPSGSVYLKAKKIEEFNINCNISNKNKCIQRLYVPKGQGKTLINVKDNLFKEIDLNKIINNVEIIEIDNINYILDNIN
ncbi:MAG: hypothetical protein QW757_05745 [Candidatus Woesearchaeota archaeon]